MSWIILISSLLVIGFLYYRIKTILYYHKLEKLHTKIKICTLAIFKIKNAELHDFNKLLAIQKDLYAQGVRPKGLLNKKYFTVPTMELTLEDVLIFSIDVWHLDSLAFWTNCSKEIGENLLNLPEDTLHKTVVFNRYKGILTGSLGDYLYKLKLDYAKIQSTTFIGRLK